MAGRRGPIFRTQYKDEEDNSEEVENAYSSFISEMAQIMVNGRINSKCSYYGIVKFN
jgi:hypothetical protein